MNRIETIAIVISKNAKEPHPMKIIATIEANH